MYGSIVHVRTSFLAVVFFLTSLCPLSLQAQLTNSSFTLVPQNPALSVTMPSAIIAVDLDGDQAPDLAVTRRGNNDNGTIAILQNQGNGAFSVSPTELPTGGRKPAAIVSGNFGGIPGSPDLIVANESSNNVFRLPNLGEGAFDDEEAVTTQTSGPIAMAVGYFDTNDDLDFAVANLSFDPLPKVTVLLSNGDGSFTASEVDVGPSDCCTFPRGIVAADVDGDGDTDLAVAMVGNFGNSGYGWSDNINILFNDGNGQFNENVNGSPGRVFLPIEDITCDRNDECHFLSIATADINGDGLPDLAVAVSEEENLPNRSTVFVLLSRGRHPLNDRWLGFGLPQPVSLPAGADPRALVLADVDGDGNADLITANHGTNNVSVLLNNGNGTFGAPRSFSTGANSGPIALTVADLNGDCAVDIAVANETTSTVAVLLNNINLPRSCPSRDTNADGRADIVWRNTVTGRVNIWLLDGLERIGAGSPGTLSNLDVQIVGIGDTDGNGTADIVWRNATTGKISIWLLNGLTRTATGSPGTAPNLAWQVVGVGDTDCDRKADLVWHNSATGRVLIWRLDGTRRVENDSPGTMSDTAWQIVGVGDVNDDCKADLVWRHNTTGEVRIWLLDGTTRLDQGSPGSVSGQRWRIAGVGDTDGDGKADLVWHNGGSNGTGDVRIWRLDGLTRLSNRTPGTIANLDWNIENVSDANGDGNADIVWRNSTTGRVLIWLLDGGALIDSGSPGTISNLEWQIQ